MLMSARRGAGHADEGVFSCVVDGDVFWRDLEGEASAGGEGLDDGVGVGEVLFDFFADFVEDFVEVVVFELFGAFEEVCFCEPVVVAGVGVFDVGGFLVEGAGVALEVVDGVFVGGVVFFVLEGVGGQEVECEVLDGGEGDGGVLADGEGAVEGVEGDVEVLGVVGEDLLGAVGDELGVGVGVFDELFLEEVAQGDEGDGGQGEVGAGGGRGFVFLVFEGWAGLCREPEAGKGVVGWGDKDVGEEVVFAAQDGECGGQEGAEGFAAAGQGGDEAVVGVLGEGVEELVDEVGGGGVVGRGADVVEFVGEVVGGVSCGDGVDVGVGVAKLEATFKVVALGGKGGAKCGPGCGAVELGCGAEEGL